MQQYLNPQNYLWGDFAAAAVMSALPITIVFLLAQRWSNYLRRAAYCGPYRYLQVLATKAKRRPMVGVFTSR